MVPGVDSPMSEWNVWFWKFEPERFEIIFGSV